VYLPAGHPAYAAEARIRERHTDRLKQIISEIGWPTISKVGPAASRAAWLLAQHSDHDLPFQREALALMTAALPSDVDPADHAYLADRVARAEGRLQEFGSQLEYRDDGELVVQATRDPDGLDERRAAVRLAPIAEYLAGARRQLPEVAQGEET
jgi:hypothetical protein